MLRDPRRRHGALLSLLQQLPLHSWLFMDDCRKISGLILDFSLWCILFLFAHRHLFPRFQSYAPRTGSHVVWLGSSHLFFHDPRISSFWMGWSDSSLAPAQQPYRGHDYTLTLVSTSMSVGSLQESASAPEITNQNYFSFLVSRRVYSPWAFRYASGMPQECTNNPRGIGNDCEKKKMHRSPQSTLSAVCLATKIPKILMCPATYETLETHAFPPLHPEEILDSTEQAEYLCE